MSGVEVRSALKAAGTQVVSAPVDRGLAGGGRNSQELIFPAHAGVGGAAQQKTGWNPEVERLGFMFGHGDLVPEYKRLGLF